MSQEYEPVEDTALSRSRDAQLRAEQYREKFYELVMKAVDELPPLFRERLENVDIVVADWPSPAQLAKSNIRGRFGLLGLYEGVPHTRRGPGYSMVLPDKITVFRKPIEARCRSWKEVENEIGRVVRHEIAHHFGFDEATLRDIEGGRNEKAGK
ncbi:MAG: metallopeptidase family protein [Chloroflexi bacterium]|nr:metallopeptidase family protein [Chloroflexota bacterium]